MVTSTFRPAHRESYRPAPPLDALAASGTPLARGMAGPAVADLQRALNALGATPPLAVDGLFGPRTEAAVRQLGGALGAPARDGRVDARVLGAFVAQDRFDRPERGVEPWRAPRAAVRTPSAAHEAPRPAAPPPGDAAPLGPATPVAATARIDGPRDAELAALQARGMDAARRELELGVREDHARHGDNRGPRIDAYAARGGMRPGGEWCGYFSGFALSEGARASGADFAGVTSMHSMQKARSFFEYRSYTNASRAENERLDALRARHEAEGSTRRWMVLSGSGGERHARAHERPHEPFEPHTLPLRAGDVAIFSRGHVGLVEGYDPTSGRLVTIEGNSLGQAVRRRTYDLSDPAVRAGFEGFGRPARGDYVPR
jgi:peptidoglycan hydrolase-like protein with peptidoglycan-binding domain